MRWSKEAKRFYFRNCKKRSHTAFWPTWGWVSCSIWTDLSTESSGHFWHTHSLEVTSCWSSVQAESVTDTSDIGPEGVGALLCHFPCLYQACCVVSKDRWICVLFWECGPFSVGQLVGWSDFTPHVCRCPPKRTISSSYRVDVLCSLWCLCLWVYETTSLA